MSGYNYATQKQQNSKLPYPFVEYGGNSFLQTYLKSRREALARISNNQPLIKSSEILLENIRFDKPIETQQLLTALLEIMKNEDYLLQQDIVYLFKTLRKRGELGKLRTSYLGRELKFHQETLSDIDD